MIPNEGVIKFKFDWKKEPLPRSVDISELISYRNKLYNIGLIGADKEGIGFGNISVLIKPSGEFVISASDTGRIKSARRFHFSLVQSVSIKDNFVSCIGMKPASSESMTHDIIYKLSPEVKSVLHVHSFRLWKKLMNKVPMTSKNISYGTSEMAYDIKRLWTQHDLKEKKILVMKGHTNGLIVFGDSLKSAYNTLLFFIHGY